MNERSAELGSIRKTADMYIEGVREGNVELLREAFHPRAMMYGSSDQGPLITEIEGLYQYVASDPAPAKTGEPHQCFIKSISHCGNAASVEMVEESSHGLDYVNYFQLLKIEGRWLIVSKLYNALSPAK